MYFESHAHYDDERFDDDRDELLASFPSEGIETVVNSSSDVASSKASIALAEKYPFFYASVGVHPHEVGKMTDADIDTLRELVKTIFQKDSNIKKNLEETMCLFLNIK